MSANLAPCAFIGEFDSIYGTTIIYTFEYYRYCHVCSNNQDNAFPLCYAQFVSGLCCATDNVISGAVHEHWKSMLTSFADRLLSSSNSEREPMIIQDHEPLAIAGVACTLPDILARGEKRKFCVFVLHHSFNLLTSQWPVIGLYFHCLLSHWQSVTEVRHRQEYDIMSNIEQNRETAQKQSLRSLLELIADDNLYNRNSSSNNNTGNYNNNNNNNNNNCSTTDVKNCTLERAGVVDRVNIINSDSTEEDHANEHHNTNKENASVCSEINDEHEKYPEHEIIQEVKTMTYARIHAFFEYVLPIFFSCVGDREAAIPHRSYEPQHSHYLNTLLNKRNNHNYTYLEDCIDKCNFRHTEIIRNVWNEIVEHSHTHIIPTLRWVRFSGLSTKHYFVEVTHELASREKIVVSKDIVPVKPNSQGLVVIKPLMVWLAEYFAESTKLFMQNGNAQETNNCIRQVSLLLDALLAGDVIHIHSNTAMSGAYFAIALSWLLPPSLRHVCVYAEREQEPYEARIVSYSDDFIHEHCYQELHKIHTAYITDITANTTFTNDKSGCNVCQNLENNNDNNYDDNGTVDDYDKDKEHSLNGKLTEENYVAGNSLLVLQCANLNKHTVHAIVSEDTLQCVFSHSEYWSYISELNNEAVITNQVEKKEFSSIHPSTLTLELVELLTDKEVISSGTNLFKSEIVQSTSDSDTCVSQLTDNEQRQCVNTLQWLVAESTQKIYKYVMYGNVYLTLLCDWKVHQALNESETQTKMKCITLEKLTNQIKQNEMSDLTESCKSLTTWEHLHNLLTNAQNAEQVTRTDNGNSPIQAENDHKMLIFLGGATVLY